MNLSDLNTAISLLFAPSFLLFSTFYGFENVAFSYAVLMFLYLIFSLYKKTNLREISTPLIYFVFVFIAYFLTSMALVKTIPALISGGFFLFFLESYINRRETILKFAKRFYKKGFTQKEESYIAKSDKYWVFITLGNTLIQIALIFNNDDRLWAFYSSVGWYLYLFIALVIQIIYGKIYAFKS